MSRKYRPEFGREALFALENTPVDYVANVDGDFLQRFNLRKGDFNSTKDPLLVDALSKEVKISAIECGGSAANVACGYANLGFRSAFAGSIGNDYNAARYRTSLVIADVVPYLFERDQKNGVCYTLITPDGERTFLVHMGASSDIKPHEVPNHVIPSAAFLHSSAYALDSISGSLEKAIETAVKNNVRVSFDIASKKSIEKHNGKINELLNNVDILLINKEEAESFGYKKGKEQDLIDYFISKHNIGLVAFKLGKDGAIISSGSDAETAIVPPYKVNIVNTNGAGDGFAAGLLYSLTKGNDILTTAKVANYYASRVIMQHPARLESRIYNIEEDAD